MKLLHKDEKLEIIIPETYEENLETNKNWCTVNKNRYIHHVEKLNQTLIRFIYSDGYKMSLGVNKNDYRNGQWIDNVKNDKNQQTTIFLHHLEGDFFNIDKIKEIAKKYNNTNLENMANKIEQLSIEIKNKIKKELNNNE